MKNTKLTKILATVASLALIVLSICIVAGAEGGEELSVKINARNVSYGETVKILFAVDDTKAGENEVEVIYYLEDPTVNPDAQGYLGVEYDKGYTDKKGTEDTSDDVKYPAFYTAGFPAKHIGDAVYARAHIVGTEIYSDVERYSVVEYLLERLYLERAEGDKRGLYLSLLEYGTYAQKVVLNGNADKEDDVENFIDELVLVAIPGGTLDGKYAQGTYFIGEPITPYIEGAKGLNVTVFDISTGAGTTDLIENGAPITVEGFTMITASETAPEQPTPPAYMPDLTDTSGRILWSESNNISDYKTAGYIDEWMGSGAPLEIIDGAPYGEASKVIHMGTKSGSGNQDQLYIKTTVSEDLASVYAFETDMMVVPNGVACKYELIFQNGNAPKDERTTYRLYLSVGTDGNGQISGDGLATIAAPGITGTWFRLRAEYTDVSETQAKMVVYFNEMKVAESSVFTKVQYASVVNQVIIAAYDSAVGDAYFDNTKAEKYAPPYTPDMSDLATRETYEDGDSLNQFKWNSWHGNQGDSAYGIVDGKPYGVDSKVYNLNTANGYKPEIAFEWTKVSDANSVAYESDMMLTTTGTLCPEMTLRVDGSTALVTFYMKTTGDKVQLLDGSKNAIATIAEDGEWFRFRVEYVNGADENATVKFYVDGILLPTTLTAKGSAGTIGRFKLWTSTTETGDVYFDNTKIIFTK